MHLNPAEYVIYIFGGVRKTARAIGRDPSTISRWRKPKNLRGGGGFVPTSAQQLILQKAKELELDFKASDLIEGRKLSSELKHEEKAYQVETSQIPEANRPATEILF